MPSDAGGRREGTTLLAGLAGAAAWAYRSAVYSLLASPPPDETTSWLVPPLPPGQFQYLGHTMSNWSPGVPSAHLAGPTLHERPNATPGDPPASPIVPTRVTRSEDRGQPDLRRLDQRPARNAQAGLGTPPSVVTADEARQVTVASPPTRMPVPDGDADRMTLGLRARQVLGGRPSPIAVESRPPATPESHVDAWRRSEANVTGDRRLGERPSDLLRDELTTPRLNHIRPSQIRPAPVVDARKPEPPVPSGDRSAGLVATVQPRNKTTADRSGSPQIDSASTEGAAIGSPPQSVSPPASDRLVRSDAVRGWPALKVRSIDRSAQEAERLPHAFRPRVERDIHMPALAQASRAPESTAIASPDRPPPQPLRPSRTAERGEARIIVAPVRASQTIPRSYWSSSALRGTHRGVLR